VSTADRSVSAAGRERNWSPCRRRNPSSAATRRPTTRAPTGNTTPASPSDDTPHDATPAGRSGRAGLTGEERLGRAIAAANGATFRRLWNGDASGYGTPEPMEDGVGPEAKDHETPAGLVDL